MQAKKQVTGLGKVIVLGKALSTLARDLPQENMALTRQELSHSSSPNQLSDQGIHFGPHSLRTLGQISSLENIILLHLHLLEILFYISRKYYFLEHTHQCLSWPQEFALVSPSIWNKFPQTLAYLPHKLLYSFSDLTSNASYLWSLF